jgi:hypothetical protein
VLKKICTVLFNFSVKLIKWTNEKIKNKYQKV